MGADIHMFIEYRNKEHAQNAEKIGRKPYWWSFGDHLNPGRNYTMFAILAEVRGDYPESFEPKGILPRDEMSTAAAHEAYMYIVNDEDQCCENEHLESGYITRTNALKWAERGYAVIEDQWMEALDYHSHSWMNTAELEEAFQHYLKRQAEEWPDDEVRVPVEYQAMLAAMKALEQDGENEVRVVFWFDN
jgi:hypothetical protein